MIELDRSRIIPFLDANARQVAAPLLESAQRQVLEGNGPGAEMLGWRKLALSPDEALLTTIEQTAKEIRERAEVLICIGIGGSYLGAEAVIKAASPYFGRTGPEVIFAGHHLSPAYHKELLESLKGKSVYVNVISKSGSTLEPALAFRLIRQFMEENFEDADRRIIATTGPTGGRLNPLADAKGYRRFIIPGDVGGRFSVLTPVGLLPIAVAGVDIRALVAGAQKMMTDLESFEDNPALDYAADRYVFHEAGFTTEVFAVMEPKLAPIGAWWQQLFGESEGKDGKGLFPSVVQYTTDLHSLGQYVQDGRRNLLETFLTVEEGVSLPIPSEQNDVDGLNDLAGKEYAFVNQSAYAGTAEAHLEGNVPSWTITLPCADAESVGALIAFYQHAVAVSGYMLGVNPFDQPGVEAYKQKMYRLLGR